MENPEDGFQFAHFSIDRWLKVVAGGYLDGTSFGHTPDAPVPTEVQEQGVLRQVYLMDLALFIGAERTAVEIASGLTRLAPDHGTMVFLASQTMDEARHFEAFATRFGDLGLDTSQWQKIGNDYMSPAYRAFLDILLETVDRDDFLGGIVGLNIILEGMAFPLYDYETRYWAPFDPALVEIIEGAFKDECRHVGFGEKYLQYRLHRDVDSRNRIQSLVDDLSRKMNEAFDEFLSAFVGFYDLAIADYPDRCEAIEIIPGRPFAKTSAEEQVQWLRSQIERGHEKRLRRLGLELCV